MISFGSVFLELAFGQVPKLPRPGEEVFTEEFAVSCGGPVSRARAAWPAGDRGPMDTLPVCDRPNTLRRYEWLGL